MPFNFRIAENTGSPVEKGTFVRERNAGGEELKTMIDIQEALNKQNKRILRGEFYRESLDSTTIIDEKDESDEYTLELDEFHRLDLSSFKGDSHNAGLLKEEIKSVTTETFFVMENKIAYTFGNIADITTSLNEKLDTDFESLSVDVHKIQNEFTSFSSGTWRDVDGKTRSATLHGDIANSELAKRMSPSGQLTWLMGDIKFNEGEYSVGVSSDNDSIVIYGINDAIRAAELAIDLISRQ